MRSRLPLLSVALSLTLASAALAPKGGPIIEVAYPPQNYTVAYDHTIFEGRVSPGAGLSVNGRALNVGPDGLFMEWLPLRPGRNVLKLVSSSGAGKRATTFTVTSTPPHALPTRPTAIRAGTLTPDRSLNLFTRLGTPGRLDVRFQGSPGGRASVTVGTLGPFVLREEPPTRAQAAGWYSASLTLPENLPLGTVPVRVRLSGPGGAVVSTAAGKVTSTPTGTARVAEIIELDVGQGVNPVASAISTGPAATDLLFARTGQRVRVLGDTGRDWLLAGPGGLNAASRDTLKLLPVGTPAPAAQPGLPQLLDTGSEWQVRLSTAQRTLYDLTETAAGGSVGLTWRLADATRPAGQTLNDGRTPGLSWAPEGDSLKLELTVPQSQLWGYFVSYEGTETVLHVRKAPLLDPLRPLAGRLIVIDPGHGGVEKGGAGSLGESEKQIVLPIAVRVAELLRAQGADARLTRERDVRVPLYDRPLMAENVQADLLVSIHANALPDGVDPRNRRGLELHTFHPMSWGLARSLLRSLPRASAGLTVAPPDQAAGSLIGNLSVPTDPGLRLSNLALTRPTAQRSLLIETSYLTEAGDLRRLMSPAGREALAQGIAQGIADDYAAQAKIRPAWAGGSAPSPVPPKLPQPTPPPIPPQGPPELSPTPPPPQPDAPLVPLPAPDPLPEPPDTGPGEGVPPFVPTPPSQP
jgi:N-acetylmuramoyl-L-alanine amidase